MQSITVYLENELKLKVNKEKSAVDRPWKRKFLGFSFYHKKGEIGIRTQDEWIRRRMWMCVWKQWRKIKTRHDNLVKLGIDDRKAWESPTQEKATGGSPIALSCPAP